MQTKIRLLDDCRQALTEAQARSRKYDEGSEKMSDIASKARRLAETQELDAQEIEEMAGEAFDLSSKANMLAVSGLAEQAKTAGQIHTILVIILFIKIIYANLIQQRLKCIFIGFPLRGNEYLMQI